MGFQNFEKEPEEIIRQYGKPEGGLILIKKDLDFIGCTGIRKFKLNIAELKRMYIKPGYNGLGMGRVLLENALMLTKELKYKKIYLDTLSSMKTAVHSIKLQDLKKQSHTGLIPAKKLYILKRSFNKFN